MDTLRTIEEVIAYHLKRLRGDNTQSDMAELLGLPLRSYQYLEKGSVPRPETRRLIAEKLGISETELFLDPDLSSPTADQVSEVISLALQNDSFRETLSQALRSYMPVIRRKK